MKELTTTFLDYRRLLHSFLTRFLPNRHDIEDIVQETYVKALEADTKGRIHSPKAYLFQTAKNLALKEIAKSSYRLTDNMGDSDPTEVLVNESYCEDQFESHHRLSVFCQALRRLPAQCRRVYVLRKVYGFSHKEIASYLGISTNTVERHMAKGMSRCNEHMKAFGYPAHSTGNSKRNMKES